MKILDLKIIINNYRILVIVVSISSLSNIPSCCYLTNCYNIIFFRFRPSMGCNYIITFFHLFTPHSFLFHQYSFSLFHSYPVICEHSFGSMFVLAFWNTLSSAIFIPYASLFPIPSSLLPHFLGSLYIFLTKALAFFSYLWRENLGRWPVYHSFCFNVKMPVSVFSL